MLPGDRETADLVGNLPRRCENRVQILSPKVKLVMAVHICSPRAGRAGRRSAYDLVGHPTWLVQWRDADSKIGRRVIQEDI